MTIKEKLSLFWIFLFLNFIFCDVFSLFYPQTMQDIMQGVGGMAIDQNFLLMFAVIMELGMLMVLGSRFLAYSPNRWANILVGAFLIVVQVGSLFAGAPTLHYWFFSVVEVATLAAIVWTAWGWRQAEA